VATDAIGFLDIACVVAGAMVPAALYESLLGSAAAPLTVLPASLVAAIVVHMCLRTWGLYDPQRMHDFPWHPGCLFLALAIGIVAVGSVSLPHITAKRPALVWSALWFLVSYGLLVANRLIARHVLATCTAEGRFHEKVAVFGAGEIARRVRDHLVNPELGIDFAGVFDDRAGSSRTDCNGLQVAGTLDDLIREARAEGIDRVIIALPQSAGQRMTDIARKLEQLPASLHIVTHIASDLVPATKSHKVSSLGTLGMLDVKKPPLSDWGRIIKRLEDRILGSLLLALAAPLFPIIVLAIKLDSPGPAFFRQRRRGLNQNEFEVIKFRTMCVMEDGANVRQAVPGDARVSRIGAWLRRTSLDELPQLINVLKGDMSLVGPRPHAVVHDEKFSEMLESYANRHQMKPGITGLAQVTGHRGPVSNTDTIEARVKADLEYINNWSLALDLSILVRTVKAVFVGKNAH
jgi:putative colanic acid biosynthesis UDP-glucose lipid carrier transferase